MRNKGILAYAQGIEKNSRMIRMVSGKVTESYYGIVIEGIVGQLTPAARIVDVLALQILLNKLFFLAAFY